VCAGLAIGVSAFTVERWWREKKLPYCELGHVLGRRIPRAALNEFVTQKQLTSGPLEARMKVKVA
jgi:excisionase family DNA binding protein